MTADMEVTPIAGNLARPEPYRAVLDRRGTDPARTLFVAGSPADIPGAAGVGMPVFWHNRGRLLFVADKARPLFIADTLDPLAELVRVSAGV